MTVHGTGLDRRKFLVTSLAGALAAPLGAGAQQARRISRIGYLSPGTQSPAGADDAFRDRLRDFGWVHDQNLTIAYRYAAGAIDRLPALAVELIELGVDVLVAWSPAAALAAKRATSRIPIIFLAVGNPVGFGLASTLARPGGNLTGISFDAADEIYAKAFGFLKEAVPSVNRVVRLSSTEPASPEALEAVRGAARKLGIEHREVQIKGLPELESAVQTAKSQGVDAVYFPASGFSRNFARQLADVALAHRLPSLHWFKESVVAGGLLCYASSLTGIARRGAEYVDKILRGVKPGDLPVEQPTVFELVINRKTARALGLTIPPSLLARADQVIE